MNKQNKTDSYRIQTSSCQMVGQWGDGQKGTDKYKLTVIKHASEM